ncbi:pentatricopeptide repeat-containing protein At2g13600-like [Magnolia sinica]|uniref:pentatricopeptide repeat-containing protein At2g13600-like n=1 Tax=Magnolia sinica TaxID=86752 RepID=UPI00265AB084|nr:pentatricopeptide repeat-containing protein At2g13600-like [Magnolia sinica]
MQALLRSLSHKTFSTRAFHRRSLPQHPSIAEELSLLALDGRLREAICVLRRPDAAHFPATSEAFLPLIRACIKFKAFSEGREIHKHIVESGVRADMILQNNLMILYSKCGHPDLAREVFDGMIERNLFSWTAMIGACLNSGSVAEAFEFYEEMVVAGIRADHFLYPLVLKSCAGMGTLGKGRRVHADVIRSGFCWDLVVMNSLIDMYAKCESVVDAERVFDEMALRDVVTWTSMLVGYVQTGHHLEALDFFKGILSSDIKLCSATLAAILPVFSDLGCLNLTRQIHGLIIGSGFGLDKFIGSALIDTYASCRGLGYSRLVFDRIKERDVVCWNAMIKGYAQMELFDEAVELLLQMHVDQVNPNKTTWDCIISQYLQSGSIRNVLFLINRLENVGIRPNSISISALLQMGESVDDIQHVRELHAYMRRGRYDSDNAVASRLIDMYSKFGEVEVAREIFDRISVNELGSWNSMISCYAINGHADRVMELFDLMHRVGVEPNVTSWNAGIARFVERGDFDTALEMFAEMKWLNQKQDVASFDSILPVVGNLNCPMQGKQLHNMFLRNGSKMSRFVCTAFVNMYGNCGNIDYAVKLFESMVCKDIVSWNAIISGLAKNGFLDEASKTFHDMETAGAKANIITWTSLISGYAQNGRIDESLKHFRQFQDSGLRPNSVTITSILPACAQSAALSHGRAIHGYIIRSGLGYDDLFVLNALIDMFIKCGCMEYAERVFRRLGVRDVVSWNTIIQGNAVHGRAKAALAIFNQMLVEGIAPDSVTFIGVLSACSHAGLIDEGWKEFNGMYSKYGIIPSGKHYACMVDLLGRGGRFEDVRNFIIQMPLQPTASLWGALLSSCRTHRNVEMAEYAAGHLLELQPENPGNYVILSNIYASAGRWDGVDRMRKMMIERGVRKQPGCSWIEVRNHIHGFTAENPSHPDMEIVTRTLLDLMATLAEEGYIPKTKVVDVV